MTFVSSLLLAVLKIVFLALMWIFIFFIGQVIRTDLFGRKVTSEELADVSAEASAHEGRRRSRRRSRPTHLVVTDGSAQGASASLPRTGAILIGRSTNADIDIEDDYASSRHARVYNHSGVWVIEDLQSTNGTYVNGHQITQPTIIGAEDSVRIGRTHLVLEAR